VAGLIDFISRANILLGGDPISGLTDDSVETATYSALWPMVLSMLLSAHEWRFATTTVPLSQLTDPPGDPRFQYAFQLPANIHTVREIRAAGLRKLSTHEYIVEGTRVFSHLDRLYLKYVRDLTQTDLNNVPGWFGDAFTANLAYSAQEKILPGSTKAGELAANAKALKNLAIQRDLSLEPPQDAFEHETWRTVR
jgi:hypothetical protein